MEKEYLMRNNVNLGKKTKIVATLGPASESYEGIEKLIESGVDIFRLNFSHGEHETHKKRIDFARDIAKKKGIYIPILLDTKGPEIRVGTVENNGVLIEKGQELRISMNTDIIGTNKKISMNYQNLYDEISINEHLKIDDGNLDLVVTGKDEKQKELITEAVNTHLLKSRKGVNAPTTKLSIKFISKKDEDDLVFGCQNDVDFIAASFTSRPENIIDIKNILKKCNKEIPVLAKIENDEGVNNMDEIIKVADGIMVARGDLGINVPFENVPIYQKKMIEKCRKAGKPVIVATQMLESMQTKPIPTRAEVSDVYLAVKESADAIMLSGETASGNYPFGCVATDRKITTSIEKFLDYKELFDQSYCCCDSCTSCEINNKNNAVASSVTSAALVSKAKAIFVFTKNSNLVFQISKTRPCCSIISITDDKKILSKGGIYWGVYNILVNEIPNSIEKVKEKALQFASDMKIKGNIVIVKSDDVDNFVQVVNI